MLEGPIRRLRESYPPASHGSRQTTWNAAIDSAVNVKEAALPLGLQIYAVRARTTDDFDTAFAALAQHSARQTVCCPLSGH